MGCNMKEKESAPPSAVTVGQGIKQNDVSNLSRRSQNVKFDLEKLREYQYNSYTSYRMLAVIQSLILEASLFTRFRSLGACNSSTISSIVSIVRNPDNFHAYYNNVVSCGNAFCCPVCAPRIMSKRRTEIENAVYAWFSWDALNTCFMLTFTASHSINFSLADFLVRFKTALQMFWRDGRIKRFLSSASRVGRITATEIQYGSANGWHPHQHVLLFCRRCSIDIDLLRTVWLSCLAAVGLSASVEIGLVVTDGHDPSIAGAYLSKIGMEMAFSNLKQGRGRDHFSPMQLIFNAASGEEWAAERFLEVLNVSRGLHSLQWSRGLKASFGIGEVSDQEVAAGVAETETVPFIHLLADDFRDKFSYTEKALLRNCAGEGDLVCARALLDRLGATYSTDIDDMVNYQAAMPVSPE